MPLLFESIVKGVHPASSHEIIDSIIIISLSVDILTLEVVLNK